MNILLLFPDFPKIESRKICGAILSWLNKYGNKTVLLTNEIPDNESLIIDGVEIIKKRKIAIFDISFGLIFYLLTKIRNVDCLLLYHLTLNSAVAGLFYRLFSKSGLLVVKLDMDGRSWRPSVDSMRRTLKIYNRLFGGTEIVPKLISRVADLLIIEAPESRERVIKRYPYFAEKTVVVPNGVDDEKFENIKNTFPKEERGKTILYVGSICYRKGIDLLIEAFSMISDSFPEWKLEIVGEKKKDISGGTWEKDFQERMQKLISLNLQNRVTFLGALYGKDLVKKYSESEIFCFPSRYESVGIVLLEAMYFELPIVSSNAGCADYILDYGQCGIILKNKTINRMGVEELDVNELARTLKSLIEDENLRKEYSERAKKRCLELFTWKKIVKDINDQIQTLVRAGS